MGLSILHGCMGSWSPALMTGLVGNLVWSWWSPICSHCKCRFYHAPTPVTSHPQSSSAGDHLQLCSGSPESHYNRLHGGPTSQLSCLPSPPESWKLWTASTSKRNQVPAREQRYLELYMAQSRSLSIPGFSFKQDRNFCISSPPAPLLTTPFPHGFWWFE